MYGTSVNSLATNLNCSVDEAQNIVDTLFKTFPDIKKYIDNQKKYPFSHKGAVRTFFGDILKSPDFKFLHRSDGSIDPGVKARIERHAVNLPIQGGTSVTMCGAFFNVMRKAKENNFCVRSIITVHDSCTSMIPVYKLWSILDFCKEHFTEHAYKQCGIKLTFDMLVGKTYHDSGEIKNIDKDTISISANAHSLLRILDALDEVPQWVKYTCDTLREKIIPNYVTDAMNRFIKEKGTSIIKDESFYTIKLHKEWTIEDEK